MAIPFIGEIQMFGGNFAPRNYAFCNGQLLSIAQNTALFAILGTTYGGDGRTTLGLPDLRGRIPVHAGNGPGLSSRRLGSTGGAETTTLSNVGQLAPHKHTHIENPTLQGAPTGTAANTSDPSGASLASVLLYNDAGEALDAVMQAGAEDHSAEASIGNSQPINNMAPYQAVSFIIALQGIFPPRN
jgi:microcystin-dependent protein